MDNLLHNIKSLNNTSNNFNKIWDCYVTSIDSVTKFGIIKFKERKNELLIAANLTKKELNNCHKFTNEKRLCSWLAIRILLNEIMGKKTIISYDEYGAPTLSKYPQINISISHSGDLAVLILSTKKVGLDIQLKTDKIFKIAHKFVAKSEQPFIEGKNKKNYLLTLWGAKEALFKLHKKGNLDFQTQLIIAPFNFKNNFGSFKGCLIKNGINEQFDLQYLNFDNYLLVFLLNNC